ncbi:MAG: hypothetical protein JJT89_01790 [Nitriliruptoraceae bacterium]|nr:hypothetical protein [Nitriliruptoraceae bacterium]
MSRARYGRWDGRQDPLGERPDIGAVLDQLSDDLLMGAGGRDALDALRRRGLPGGRGLDALRRAVAERRAQLRSELDADGPLVELAEELDEVIAMEREALAQRDDDEARFAELDLDTLPRDPAGRFRGLGQHDFASPDAAAAFEAIADRLRKDLLDAHLKAMTGALESVTPEDLQRIAAMIAELNQLLAARADNLGIPPADEPANFAAFLGRHGDLVPTVTGEDGQPRPPATLDELLAEMARRAQAAQQFLDSLPPDQRAQLQDLARQVFDDVDLAFQLDQLGRTLPAAFPDGLPGAPGRGRGTGQGQGEGGEPDVPSPGGPGGPMSRMVDAWERLGELDDLESQLRARYEGATLDDVDEDALRRALGDDAVRDLQELKTIERELERSGAMRVRGGELELTPRGARLLGEKALARLLARVRRTPATRQQGADPEPTGQTRPWRFGDREPLATGASVRNAVMRRAAQGIRPSDGPRGVRLHPDDLEIVEQEVRPRTATALLLDLSFSMPLQGHFIPAKRMALALHALIEGSHRQDSLHLIGFSDYARRMQPADLAAVGFERVYGTNMHHAFLLARRVLGDDPRPVKRVIMVTDGEPTAHLIGGRSVFNWPPIPETLEATLREGMRLARSGIELDIFLLEDAPGLVAFAERLAAMTGGTVTQMSAEEVGRTVIRDYDRSG